MSDDQDDQESPELDLNLPDLDLAGIEALDGTALGQMLNDLYRSSRDITAEGSPLGQLFSSFSSHSRHSAFSSFSSHSSTSWPT
ncbi:hypothetical protein NE236_26730 [Actinoallomurus purpureus]|uniref:hypothetical protein n=1 Tax=Actinoallomurus purpureus TaxID=478114 RepID=UPI0020925064|nr:hypothetical protein [Actinoallomurus purpureus]MCO6008573.1 hypothetical protein [Actinoallomurus purpureus]